MSKRPGPGISPAPITLAKRRRPQHQSPKEEKVTLERILGLTCLNSSSLAVCKKTGYIAYPAGCIAVIYLPKKNRQLHVLNNSRKPISCLCLSSDGKYLVTGESGHLPCVRVWDISSSPVQVAEMKGHNFGISCIAFSPNLKYLVSVGYHHDMQIYVWNWKNSTSVASNKITSRVCGVAFSEDGSYFVTAGNRSVKFWYFDTSGRDGRLNRTHPLKGRSAILGEHQDNCFVSVVCGCGPLANHTYTITKTGMVCLFDAKRLLDRFTETKASPAYCLVVNEQYLFCGCSEGVIRIFDPRTLDYLVTVPKPHSLGVDVAAALDASQFSAGGEKYPDAIAMAMDDLNKRLTVIYNDHSLYVWDLKNIKQIGKTHSFLYHNACIWDICMYPQLEDKNKALLPHNCFITCSSDNTIRFWCVDNNHEGTGFIKNIYSKELMRVMYTDPDTSCLKDVSNTPGDASAVADTTRGVRSIRFHPNGQHLAVGDRAGNLKVYDLHFMDQIIEVVAHDSEILCIEYSPLFQDLQFLATASRDRLIHVFTTEDSNYNHVQTLDDHSASITAVKFTARDNLQLLSCGADKSITFRSMEKSPDVSFQRSNHIAGKASIYDMDIDVAGKLMATAGQDRVLRIYHIASGKQKSVIKTPTGDDGSLIKVTLDPSGLYAATSSSDKTVSLFDFYSGECLAKLYGHSEVVTQLQFSRDCKYLYSVSGDSCIFIWRLSRALTQAMHDRLVEIGKPLPTSSDLTPLKAPSDASRRETYSVPYPVTGTDQTDSGIEEQDSSNFRLSVSQLPRWAQKQVIARPSIAKSISTGSLERATGQSKTPTPVEGRWAQRVSEGHMTFASQAQSSRVRTDSDTEIEDVTTEMTKVMSDQEVEVIDLTEDTPAANVVSGACVTVRREEGGEALGEEEEEEEEEEVIYPTLGLAPPDVDPCTFFVTTPEKPLRLELENLDDYDSDTTSPAITPESSPPVERGEFVFREEHFLKTQFESLTTKKIDELFQSQLPEPPDVRLSISTKFLSRGLRNWKEQALGPGRARETTEAAQSSAQVESAEDRGGGNRKTKQQSSSTSVNTSEPNTVPGDLTKHRSFCSSNKDSESRQCKDEPEPATSTPDPGTPVIVVTESKDHGEGMASHSQPQDNSERVAEKLEAEEELGEMGDQQIEKEEKKKEEEMDKEEMMAEKEAGKRKSIKLSRRRRKSIEEDISKTKKRLQELGYALPSKTSDKEDTVSESTSEESIQSGSCSPLLSRANRIIQDLDRTFSKLAAIHEEAVSAIEQEGVTPEETRDYEETLIAVATAVSSLKNKTVSMANENRKKWRGKDKSSGYNFRSTPSRGTPMRKGDLFDAESTETASSQKTKSTVEAGSAPPVFKLAEVAYKQDKDKEKETLPPASQRNTQATATAGTSVQSVSEETHTSQPESDITMNPAMVELLERYSEQLLLLVQQKIHSDVS